MQGTKLLPHVTVTGEMLTINVDDFAESFPNTLAGPTEEEFIEQLTKKLLDYQGEISYLAVGNFTWEAFLCRHIFMAIFVAMACRPRRPIIVRLGITDRSFETFKDLQKLVHLHRYVKHWTLTFNVDDIPRLSDQILKPFHDAPWANRLTVLSNNRTGEINHQARDNFTNSVMQLASSKSRLNFEHIVNSNVIIY